MTGKRLMSMLILITVVLAFLMTGPAAGTTSEKVPDRGDTFGLFIIEAEKAYSRVQEGILSLFDKPELPFDRQEWSDALTNLNQGKGTGHLVMTLFVAGLFVLIGWGIEFLVKKSFGTLRQRYAGREAPGFLPFIGRVASNFLMNASGLCGYALTTFALFATFYDLNDPGYFIVLLVIVSSYWIRLIDLTAQLILSPARPSLRLFPLQDKDATFLYRWIISIVVTAITISTVSTGFKLAGIGLENFNFLYSLSGLSISILLVVMIWCSRKRVARAIRPGEYKEDLDIKSLRGRIAASWHWFAMIYVIGMGLFWFVKQLSTGLADISPLLSSLLMIPVFVALIHWTEHLLDLASGRSPSSVSGESEIPGCAGEPKTSTISYLQQHSSVIKRFIRILIAAMMFFVIMGLWGIDLPIARLFTSTALNIIGMVLLGFVVWQFITARIDKRLREEIPEEEETEEGGHGGSRMGTLLVLFRKFLLSMLFVILSLTILSSLGVDISPLIAGAGVIGLAIGFGSQALVKDILSGVFFLIDDAFRVGDYIETSGIKGTVQHISLRSVKLRHPRGMVFTIPFGDMGAIQNFSRDYIITKLNIRVRYDADIGKIRKIVKRISKELEQHEEIGPVLLSPIKSQGVKEMDDSAMILRVKFKTLPGEQFAVRGEVYKLIQQNFRKNGIEFAHRNVTVYLPPEDSKKTPDEKQDKDEAVAAPDQKIIRAAAAAALAENRMDGELTQPV